MGYKSVKYKPKLTKEMRDELQSKSTKWANEVYDQAEDVSKLFMKNFQFLCKKHNLKQKEVFKRVGEHGFKFREVRMSEFARLYGTYPALVEMCYFSKFFGVSPADMIGRDLEAEDRLRRSIKHSV